MHQNLSVVESGLTGYQKDCIHKTKLSSISLRNTTVGSRYVYTFENTINRPYACSPHGKAYHGAFSTQF